MTRKLLISAAANAAAECGYSFHTGFGYRMDAEIKRLPAAWMQPPKLAKKEGRQEGMKHYAVTLNLLDKCNDHTPQGKEAVWSQMEEAACEICRVLAASDCITGITGLKCSPAEFSLTNHGELSLAAEFNVSMPYCNQSQD